MKQRILGIIILALLAEIPAYGETLTVAVIRVSFQPDMSPATAGDGQFLMTDESGLICSDWVLDPPPHDKQYFEDHLRAANHYWQKVSGGIVSIDTINSKVYPVDPESAFVLPHEMLYYQPYLQDFDETAQLIELSRDAIELADPEIDFSDFSTVMIVHAGMGGDFAFALDPTPGNIPSAYLSTADLSEYGQLETEEGNLRDVIIVPESQNFMQYDETRSLFEDAIDPCFYQVGLNGTMALMLGFHLGLQPMFDTETGKSLLGGFALMDQGSNNWHGIVPAYPNPYTRIRMGWVAPVQKGIGDNVSLRVDDPPVKIQITENEYYLIENRQRNLIEPTNMTSWIDTLGGDTVSVITGSSGVVIEVDEQHAGLPGNGLYIWHVNEGAENTLSNPNGGKTQLVDFVEADGAQDMGHETQLIFADFLETGWWFDTWFKGNEGWFDLNRGVNDTAIHFSSQSFPSTIAGSGLDTYLRIDNISDNGLSMSFRIGSDRLINTDGLSLILGWGTSIPELWGVNADDQSIESYRPTQADLSPNRKSNLPVDSLIGLTGFTGHTFRYPWVSPKQKSGVKLFSLLDNQRYEFTDLDSLFELRLNSDSAGIQFFAKENDNYSNISISGGQYTQSSISGFPLTDFGQETLPILIAPAGETVPKPFSVVNPNSDEGERVVVYWDDESGASRLFTSVDDIIASSFTVDRPNYILPIDADQNGIFDIALFTDHLFYIYNRYGVAWNGSPAHTDTIYGNPVIAPFISGELGIFLRHKNSYAIYSFDGILKEQGLLPEAQTGVENEARYMGDITYVITGDELLYFSGQDNNETPDVWLGTQGNVLGDRTLLLFQSPASGSYPAKASSAYNYPNPVESKTTTIRAWIGDADEWSIEIFSMNGSQLDYVELDVDQNFAYNEWVWDASSVSNGVYLVHVLAGELSEILKVAVIR